MTMTYTWKINSIKVRNEGSNIDAVVQTYWEKTGTDENGNVGKFIGATPFTSVNVPPGEFVPYEQLTQEIVLGWIQSIVIADYETHVNNQIQKQIDEKVNPIVEKAKLPWESE
jgi:hypothetical protein